MEEYENKCFCRLCLRVIIDAKISLQDHLTHTLVKNFVPDLEVQLFTDPQLCKICLEDLLCAYNIQKSLKININNPVTPKKGRAVCFLCLTVHNFNKKLEGNQLKLLFKHLCCCLRLDMESEARDDKSFCRSCTEICKCVVDCLRKLHETNEKVILYCTKNKLTSVKKRDLKKLHQHVNVITGSDKTEAESNIVDSFSIKPFNNQVVDLTVEEYKSLEKLLIQDDANKSSAEPKEESTVNKAQNQRTNSHKVAGECEKENKNLNNILKIILIQDSKSITLQAKQVENTHIITCPICSVKSSQQCFAVHMKKLHAKGFGGIFYKCALCPYQTKIKGDLLRGHSLVHKTSNETPMYKCAICEYSCKRKPHLERHMLIHCKSSLKEEHKCPKCSYKTKVRSYLVSHMHIHKDPKNHKFYKCSQCLYQTFRKKHLSRHMNTHRDKKDLEMLKCLHCEYQTPDPCHLKSHVTCKHTDPEEGPWYQCDHCEYRTRYKYYIRRHVDLMHSKSPKSPLVHCLHCPYSTRRKDGLAAHIKYAHMDSKRLKCDTCEYAAKTVSNLRKHQRLQHKDIKVELLECDKCVFITHIASNFHRHKCDTQDKNNGELQRYKCNVCGVRTNVKTRMQMHKAINHVNDSTNLVSQLQQNTNETSSTENADPTTAKRKRSSKKMPQSAKRIKSETKQL